MRKMDSNINIRISKELKEAADKVAKDENRTLSNLVIYLLTQYVKESV